MRHNVYYQIVVKIAGMLPITAKRKYRVIDRALEHARKLRRNSERVTVVRLYHNGPADYGMSLVNELGR